MRLKVIKFLAKTDKDDIWYYRKRKRAFLARLRGCKFPKMRVLVRYIDDKDEYPKGARLENDTGWYENKRRLYQAVKTFLEEC